jgi:hypothetical protein
VLRPTLARKCPVIAVHVCQAGGCKQLCRHTALLECAFAAHSKTLLCTVGVSINCSHQQLRPSIQEMDVTLHNLQANSQQPALSKTAQRLSLHPSVMRHENHAVSPFQLKQAWSAQIAPLSFIMSLSCTRAHAGGCAATQSRHNQHHSLSRSLSIHHNAAQNTTPDDTETQPSTHASRSCCCQRQHLVLNCCHNRVPVCVDPAHTLGVTVGACGQALNAILLCKRTAGDRTQGQRHGGKEVRCCVLRGRRCPARHSIDQLSVCCRCTLMQVFQAGEGVGRPPPTLAQKSAAHKRG